VKTAVHFNIRVRVDREEQGSTDRDVGWELGWSLQRVCAPSQNFFLEFSSKECTGLCMFIAKNILVVKNRDCGFNRPPEGLKM